MTAQPADIRVFEALANKYCRQLLVALLAENPQHDEDLDPLNLLLEGQDEADLDIDSAELQHLHLPKLAEMGFIEWDSESGTIATGENWGGIEPLLRLIRDNQDQLPDDWFAHPATDD